MKKLPRASWYALGTSIALLAGCSQTSVTPPASSPAAPANLGRAATKHSSPLIYAANEYGYYAVFGYPQTGNGNVAPVFNLSGELTKIYEPEGFAIGSKGQIAVSDSDNIVTVHPAGASGNIAPSGTITCGGPDNQPIVPQRLAYDARGTLYVHYVYGYHADDNAIEIYPQGNQTGCVSNVNDIYGPQAGLGEFGGIAVDRNFVYQANASGVVGFKVTDNGQVTPDVEIAGSRTGLQTANDLAFDGNGRMYVSEENDVRVFNRDARGNTKPIAVIAGSNTGIPPYGGGEALTIAVAKDGTIFLGVQEGGVGSILVYPPGSNGNVAPSQVITGSSTDLGQMFFLGLK